MLWASSHLSCKTGIQLGPAVAKTEYGGPVVDGYEVAGHKKSDERKRI